MLFSAFRLLHVPRLLSFPTPFSRCLVAFLSLVASLLFPDRHARAGSLRSLTDGLRAASCVNGAPTNVDDGVLVEDETGWCRWALILLDAPAAEDLSPTVSVGSSEGISSASFSVFFRRQRHRDRIESLRQQLRKRRDAANSLARNMTMEEDVEEAHERRFLSDSPVTFDDARSNDVNRSSSFRTDVDGSLDDVSIDEHKVNEASETLIHWLESRRRQGGKGGGTEMRHGSRVDVPTATYAGALTASATQSRSSAVSKVVGDLDTDCFADLRPREMLMTLKRGFADHEDGNSLRSGELDESTIEHFLLPICSWQRSLEGVDMTDDIRPVFHYLASDVLIPFVSSMEATPSRGIAHAIGKLVIPSTILFEV